MVYTYYIVYNYYTHIHIDKGKMYYFHGDGGGGGGYY